MKNFAETILNQPISTLELSAEFRGITEILGMHTLADVLQHHTRDLTKLPGFSIPMVHEYVSFLELHKLGHYVDPI